MDLTEGELGALVAFRRDLHRHPELSGEERGTAGRVRAFLEPLAPDRLVCGLGGHGVAAVFAARREAGMPGGRPAGTTGGMPSGRTAGMTGGTGDGPTLLFRCELDALPIPERSQEAHRSVVAGRGHLCGHDGHMAIIGGLARALSARRPSRGRVVLLFQPAEETGAGAAAVIADPAFAEIAPDLSFSLHNMPGLPLGTASLSAGPVNCASRGLRVTLDGKTAHASLPETGISPLTAVAQLLPALTGLSRGRFPQADFAMVTVTHAVLGEPAFGIAPGRAEVWATLRTMTDDGMAALCARAERTIAKTAAAERLGLAFAYEDVFHHCENAPEAVDILRRALVDEAIPQDPAGLPIRASEDFGRFAAFGPSAMLFLGAGERHPALHNPDYDFPDPLIGDGVRMFLRVVRNVLGDG